MRRFEYGRIETRELHARVVAAVAVERGGKADLIGLLGEILARRAFVPEGFADPRDYCIRALGMSPDQAVRRLRAARTAHEFPALLPAVAAGRLGVTAINTLAPHLTRQNADELISLATGRTIEGLERVLRVRSAPTVAPMLERAAVTGSPDGRTAEVAMAPQAPAPANPAADREVTRVTEPVFVAPEPIVRLVGITAAVQSKLAYARALLSHVTRDEGVVLERALDTLIARLEVRKFAKTDRPRASRGGSRPRGISNDVKRAVCERDGGRCTFVGDHGHRCGTAELLQFDHIVPEARGGKSTEGNLRLRCRAHNQLEAERVFGEAFMRDKRAARRAGQALTPCREQIRDEALAPCRERIRDGALAPGLAAKHSDLLGALRTLGYNAKQAKWAVSRCADRSELSLEGLLRLALSYLAPTRCRSAWPASAVRS